MRNPSPITWLTRFLDIYIFFNNKILYPIRPYQFDYLVYRFWNKNLWGGRGRIFGLRISKVLRGGNNFFIKRHPKKFAKIPGEGFLFIFNFLQSQNLWGRMFFKKFEMCVLHALKNHRRFCRSINQIGMG